MINPRNRMLKRLINLTRGKQKDLARDLGINHHSLNKVLCGRNTHHIRAVLAERYGLTYEQMWGRRASYHIANLLRKEIRRQKEREARDMMNDLGLNSSP